MNRSGVLGDFHWMEIHTRDSDIPAVVRLLAAEVIGLTAVNVSWDSGHMVPTREQEQIGWRRVGELAVSPVIDETLASNWPASSCNSGRFDEWYFFRKVQKPLSLEPFCNWGGMSIDDAADLAFPGGFDLQAQLERCCQRSSLVRAKTFSSLVDGSKSLTLCVSSTRPDRRLQPAAVQWDHEPSRLKRST